MTGGGTAGILTNTSGSSNWDTQTFVLGTPKRLVYIFEQSGNGLTRTVLADGASWHTCSNFLENMKSVDGLNYLICANFPAVSDVKMYTVGKSDALAVTSDINGKEVALSTDKVTLTFSQPVYEKSLNANSITVTADGEELSGVTLGDITTTGTVGGVYTSSVDVNLPALAMSTNYEITVSGVANELGATLADSTISFSTPKPEFEISEPTISNATKGAMSEASVTIANNTASTSKYISLIYAVYNTAGTLADVVYANDTVAAKTTATITAGLKLGDDAVKAKVMVWNGLDLNAVNPFRGFVDANVAQ